MFYYVVYGANSKSVRFIEIILRLTNRSVMLIDERLDPLPAHQLHSLKSYVNFYYIFCYKKSNVSSVGIPYTKEVYANYLGKPVDIFQKYRIVLQNVLLDGPELSAEIIAKIEALDVDCRVEALAGDWSRFTIHWINLLRLLSLDTKDIILQNR